MTAIQTHYEVLLFLVLSVLMGAGSQSVSSLPPSVSLFPFFATQSETRDSKLMQDPRKHIEQISLTDAAAALCAATPSPLHLNVCCCAHCHPV